MALGTAESHPAASTRLVAPTRWQSAPELVELTGAIGTRREVFAAIRLQAALRGRSGRLAERGCVTVTDLDTGANLSLSEANLVVERARARWDHTISTVSKTCSVEHSASDIPAEELAGSATCEALEADDHSGQTEGDDDRSIGSDAESEAAAAGDIGRRTRGRGGGKRASAR